MPLVGEQAPDFAMKTTKDLDTLEHVAALGDYRGKWLTLFFYPSDFTFVCPTEITAFDDRVEDFVDLGCEILGVSTDSVYSHKVWINTSRDDNGLGHLNYPLASDITKQVSFDYDVLVEAEGIALRGLFIIDPVGTIRYQVVHDMNVGRNIDEVLRVLEAVQSGGLCVANWKPGEAELSV
jgi:peroxiredoxin (alkyl hydroperoxide reductase subunit C)